MSHVGDIFLKVCLRLRINVLNDAFVISPRTSQKTLKNKIKKIKLVLHTIALNMFIIFHTTNLLTTFGWQPLFAGSHCAGLFLGEKKNLCSAVSGFLRQLFVNPGNPGNPDILEN